MEIQRSGALLALAVALGAAGCGGTGPDIPRPHIRASVVKYQGSSTYVTVSVTAYGVHAASDASVTLNYFTDLVWNPATSGYSAPFEPLPGEDLVLTVTIPKGSDVAAGTYTAVASWFTTVPTITAPASAATWQRGVDNVVTWSPGEPTAGTPTPVHYVGISGSGGYYPGDANTPLEVPTSTTSLTVPADSLAPGAYYLGVGIGTPGLYLGGGVPFVGAAEGSSLQVAYFTMGARVEVQ